MRFWADICHASGKFFRAVLDFRSFYTDCFAGMTRWGRGNGEVGGAGMARRICVLGYVLIGVSPKTAPDKTTEPSVRVGGFRGYGYNARMSRIRVASGVAGTGSGETVLH